MAEKNEIFNILRNFSDNFFTVKLRATPHRDWEKKTGVKEKPLYEDSQHSCSVFYGAEITEICKPYVILKDSWVLCTENNERCINQM